MRMPSNTCSPPCLSADTCASYRRPPAARIAVLLAGPAANLVFAILAYWILLMQGIPGLKPVIGEVETGSFASRADLRPLDEIVAVDGKATAARAAASGCSRSACPPASGAH